MTERGEGRFRRAGLADAASTRADNGRWGWTPGVYFAGGGNYGEDAGLLMPGSYTCANTCAPMSFWAR
ncbi:hypothetical protein ACFVDQ_22695 [Streptomyces sp. NPDC057684]|uniref:hypothetical protein n=1 Tax=unclassified Streptomyces TaxID=2593676 RepID=UPI0036759695